MKKHLISKTDLMLHISQVLRCPQMFGLFNEKYLTLFYKGLGVLKEEEETFKNILDSNEEFELGMFDYRKAIESIQEEPGSFGIEDVYDFNAFQVGCHYRSKLNSNPIELIVLNKQYEEYLRRSWDLPANNPRPYFSIIYYIAYLPKDSLDVFFKTYQDFLKVENKAQFVNPYINNS